MRPQFVASLSLIILLASLEPASPKFNGEGTADIRGHPTVREYFAKASCEAKGPWPDSAQALRKLADTPAPDGSAFTSVKFHRDLSERLPVMGFAPERRSAVEIGVGSSGTTIILAALFCKVFVLDNAPVALETSATQGLPNVMHLRKDSTREGWHRELAHEGPPVSFVFVDGSHLLEHVLPDVARALALLSSKPPDDDDRGHAPLLLLHDTNIAGVSEALALVEASGALVECQEVGERLPGHPHGQESNDVKLKALITRCRQGAEQCKDFKGPLFPEGQLCKVDVAVAARVSRGGAADFTSLLPFPGHVWLLFDALDGGMSAPWGSLRFFAGARGASSGGLLLRESGPQGRLWRAIWHHIVPQGPHGPNKAADGREIRYGVLRITLELDGDNPVPRSGTLVLSAARDSLMGSLEKSFAEERRRAQRQARGFPKRHSHWGDWLPPTSNVARVPRADVVGSCYAQNLLPGLANPASDTGASGERCEQPTQAKVSLGGGGGGSGGGELLVSIDAFPFPEWVAVPLSALSTNMAEANDDWAAMLSDFGF